MDIEALDVQERATLLFTRRETDRWTDQDERRLALLLEDAEFAEAFRRASRAWESLGNHSNAPELAGLRQQAREYPRNPSAARDSVTYFKWAAAIVMGVLVGLLADSLVGTGFDRLLVYRTAIGEQRTIELEDRTRIALDADTMVRVRYTPDSRVVELVEGQSQFMVAPDPRRPFRVEVGEHTITAIGTSFNVEYLEGHVRATLMEGKVGISVGESERRSPGGRFNGNRSTVVYSTELLPGQELRIDPDGRHQLVPDADVAAATAWRQGKIILKDEPLREAVRRLNRYSRLQIRVDDAELGDMRISGVFESGDTQAFVEAIEAYLPVVAHEQGETVALESVK